MWYVKSSLCLINDRHIEEGEMIPLLWAVPLILGIKPFQDLQAMLAGKQGESWTVGCSPSLSLGKKPAQAFSGSQENVA